MLSPIIIFTYNRPNHTIQTIESLAKNYLAKESDVYIFSDAAKNNNSEEKVKIVRNYIDSLKGKNYFKSITVYKSNFNRGLANSVISGVSQIIEKFDKAIVIEDDLVSSADFLQYMNDALDYYKDDKRIWSISGYNLPIKIPKDYYSDIYLSYRGCSWGYATWKDRWQNVDWNVSDYGNFKQNKTLRKQICRGGRDMADMLDAQMTGQIDSWAIRWCYAQSKLDMFTVYPVISRINNIGLDGSGTHSGFCSHYDSLLNNNYTKCKFEDPGINYKLLKTFKNYYGTSFRYFLNKLKKHIKFALLKIVNF